MSMLSVALAFALQGQPQTDDAIILAMRDDTAFVLPLSSLHRTRQGTSATLVMIYADVDEAWEEVRRDTEVEINCSTARWRTKGANRIARDGTVRPTGSGVSGWMKISPDYPPVAALKAVVCGSVDLSSARITDWENKLPEIRATLR